ncbi:hypothetical protein [uncultured Microbacterium sp.]|uniref:hypothetical protein n=1 Tax=uncultured Microbacterium sp. TaxID=191216 RepID=UPI0028ED2813|nr:hypothetical protein [uncultured Microbacterium sp.]
MHNDNHKVARFPAVRRTATTLALAIIGSLSGLAFFLTQVAALARQLAEGAQQRVTSAIPLPDEAVISVLAGAKGSPTLGGTTFAEVSLSGVPKDLIEDVIVAHVAAAVPSLALAAILIFASAALIVGRLHWGVLSALTIAGGAVLAGGALVAELMTRSAADGLSVWMLAEDTEWFEPGFTAGLDYTVIVAGLVILALGLAFRVTARMARDADGVV